MQFNIFIHSTSTFPSYSIITLMIVKEIPRILMSSCFRAAINGRLPFDSFYCPNR